MPATATPPRERLATQDHPRRLGVRRRLSRGHVLVLVAAVLAGVANYAALRAGNDTISVLAFDRDLPAGAAVGRDDVRIVDFPADGEASAGLLRADAVEDLTGRVLGVAVHEGTVVRADDLRAPAGADGRRRMSIPVDTSRAVGGSIGVGDLVDVVAVRDGRPAYLLSAAPVVDVHQQSTTGLDGLGDFFLTVEVLPDEALCLAAAIEDGALSVLLATGQAPVPVDGCADITGVPGAPAPVRAEGERTTRRGVDG